MNPESCGGSSGTGSDAGRAPPCEHPTVDLHATTSGRLTRSSTDRVVLGVAGGIGERIGVDPIVVRLGFGLLVLAGGIGFVLYLVGILVSVDPDPAQPGPVSRRARLRPTIAFAAILAGVLLILREAGLWFGDDVVWPMALGAIGSAVLWSRAEVGRSRLASFVARGHGAPVRTVAGILLIGSGVSLFVVSGRRSGLLANAPTAAAAAIVGVLVIVGPWVARLVRQLAEERRERIRSQERAAISAHLHDSVLQTLALIQRAGDPRRMSTLARTQERELRSWLYGRVNVTDHSSVSGALDALVDQIEREHAIAVEAVSVGDAPIDDESRALLAAAREALVNAARHSGATTASLFVEIEPDRMTAYVRDQGAGFDRASVGADRRGIADSIEGRIEGVGGSAEVTSTPGAGTEVRLSVPRSIV
jgi:signal transduction histidine kinase/phage shock protein PspC (stress-responsive transcriptional regulator)